MEKTITILYDEYLHLVECKTSLEEKTHHIGQFGVMYNPEMQDKVADWLYSNLKESESKVKQLSDWIDATTRYYVTSKGGFSDDIQIKKK